MFEKIEVSLSSDNMRNLDINAVPPYGFDSSIWEKLAIVDKFYIKGLELEKNNSNETSKFKELANELGIDEFKGLMENTQGGLARLKAPFEWKDYGYLSFECFGQTNLRNVFYALFFAEEREQYSIGKSWLKYETDEYWNNRNSMIEILNFIAMINANNNMNHWQNAANLASKIKVLLENDTDEVFRTYI